MATLMWQGLWHTIWLYLAIFLKKQQIHITVQKSNLNMDDIQVRNGEMLPENILIQIAHCLNKLYLQVLR